MGHEERFPQTRMSAGCGFRKETIAGMRRNGRDAPIPAVRGVASNRRGPMSWRTVLHLAERPAAHRPGGARSPAPIDRGAVAPPCIVIHPIGRWLDAAEHALDVRRDRAVAAEETMPPEQPQIARLRHRMLRSLRRVVRVRQATVAVGTALGWRPRQLPARGLCGRAPR
jgi:hypothetical protein